MDARVKTSDGCVRSLDNQAQIIDVVNVLMEVSLVPGVVFVKKRCSFDGTPHVFLEVVDQDLL